MPAPRADQRSVAAAAVVAGNHLASDCLGNHSGSDRRVEAPSILLYHLPCHHDILQCDWQDSAGLVHYPAVGPVQAAVHLEAVQC